ncbi:Ribokinase-like protein [Chytriomyces sp. MP71]|nr:Ribokinase-like protein [Chytriomyces sp. MP71]
MPLKVFVTGACYQDVILRVETYPSEDAKVRAQSVEKRRGGNGANALQVLSQFSAPSESRAANSNQLESHLVAVLAGDHPDPSAPDTSFIISDLRINTPRVSLAHCVFRGPGYSEPTAWIIATGATRTVINHTTLPELSHAEFITGMQPVLDAAFSHTLANHNPPSLWFHFEGRNVTEIEQMVDWLIARKTEQVAVCESTGNPGFWNPVSGTMSSSTHSPLSDATTNCSRSNANLSSPGSMLPSTQALGAIGVSPGNNAIGKRDSKDSIVASIIAPPTTSTTSPPKHLPQFTISVEFEKPNRPGLDNLLPKADLLFFSKWYAEGRGFPNAPTGFLDNIRRECKPGAILFLTWSEQGCFFLVNDPRRPAQTHHVPAPAIFPVDTIGAGDTFAAGIMYSMGLQGWHVRRATEFSVRLATAKCAQVGFDGLAERVF